MISSSSYPLNAALFNDLQTIATYATGDKFAVEGDRLVLSEAGPFQAPVRTFKDMRYGGYNRYAVVAHFEKIMEQIEALKPEERLAHSHLLMQVRSVISSVQYGYRRETLSLARAEPSERFSALCDRIVEVTKGFKEEYSADTDFNAMEASRIPFKTPEGMTPDRISALSQAAHTQLIGKVQKVAVYTLIILSMVLAVPVLVVLNPLKWFIWNPAEYWIRGRLPLRIPTNGSLGSLQL